MGDAKNRRRSSLLASLVDATQCIRSPVDKLFVIKQLLDANIWISVILFNNDSKFSCKIFILDNQLFCLQNAQTLLGLHEIQD